MNRDLPTGRPPLLLLKCIIGGLLSVPVAIILEMISEQVVFYLLENVVTATRVNYGILTAIFVGLIEEGSKFFFLYRFTWKDKAFNYRFDGIVYAVFVSLGFAALENVFYVFNYGTGVALQRALLNNAAATGVMMMDAVIVPDLRKERVYPEDFYILLGKI